jgi:hypothetical protein
MAQPAGDYCLLSDLKDEIGITNADVDGRLLRAISDASRAIDAICRVDPMTFVPQALTRYFDVDASNVLSHGFSPVTDETKGNVEILPVPPLTVLTSLATDEAGTGVFSVVWTANTDFYLYPLNSEVKREIRVNNDVGRFGFPPGQRRAQLVGTWGILEAGATPLVIRRACLILTGRYYKRPDALLGMAGDPETGMQRLTQTDPDVAALLITFGGAYRQQWLAV